MICATAITQLNIGESDFTFAIVDENVVELYI
jgi:hypothetical protein